MVKLPLMVTVTMLQCLRNPPKLVLMCDAMVQAALHCFCARTHLKSEGLTKELVDRIPGKQTDRKTPMGELNWIFTAITDTIAWNVLPRALFQRLFRQVKPPQCAALRTLPPGYIMKCRGRPLPLFGPAGVEGSDPGLGICEVLNLCGFCTLTCRL